MKTNILVAVVLVAVAIGGIWYVRSQNQPAMEPTTEGAGGASQDTSSMMPASGAS